MLCIIYKWRYNFQVSQKTELLCKNHRIQSGNNTVSASLFYINKLFTQWSREGPRQILHGLSWVIAGLVQSFPLPLIVILTARCYLQLLSQLLLFFIAILNVCWLMKPLLGIIPEITSTCKALDQLETWFFYIEVYISKTYKLINFCFHF